MTSMNFSLDIDRVQSSVQAAIRPAVERALSTYDLEGAIVRALETKPREDSYVHRMMYGHSEDTSIDGMVKHAIAEIAKEYVVREIASQRSALEDAFRQMMAKSHSKLVNAFVKATQDALSSDWGFDFDVKVKHKDRGDDD